MAFAVHTKVMKKLRLCSLSRSFSLCSDRWPSVTWAVQTGLLLRGSWWNGSDYTGSVCSVALCHLLTPSSGQEDSCFSQMLRFRYQCFRYICFYLQLCSIDTTLPHQYVCTTFQTFLSFKMDFSWVISFQREVTINQGAEPCQSPHGGVGDILANRFTSSLPLWFCLNLPRKCYYGFNSKQF